MNRGTKIFLALAGIGGSIGAIVLFSAREAKAATLPPKAEPEPEVIAVPPQGEPANAPAVVLPPEPAPPSIDTAEAARLLLRWWSAEGESLLFSEEDREQLRAKGFPVFFGSSPDDLGPAWTASKQAVAAAFERLNGLSPDDGAPTRKLFDALVRWARSQELAPAQAPSSPTEPAPQIIQSPGSEPVVVVPEPAAPSAPPFVPPLQVPAPPAAAPSLPVVLASLPAQEPPAAPLPAPPIPQAPTLPVSHPAEQPSPVPSDTAQLVATLLQDEASAGWKKLSPAVAAWQKSRGLKQDSKFGPKSALTVAAEIGTVPIVRYWPTGAVQSKAVPEYRAKLLELAATAPPARAAQLRISAQREQGQGFGSKQTALAPAERVQIAQVA